MEHVRLDSVTKFYGPVLAVDRFSLSIQQGENIALLGPSGCGKTSTLNLIAGFLDPDGGSIRIGERDVAGVPPNKRNLGMVFQSYALFPHMTVGENVAFGLKLRRIAATERARRTGAVLDMVRLGGLADRYPRQLSGGQQQRVALARALVVEPELMLFDEPLSNLDAKLREEMRTELLDIQERTRITSIYVTHDQDEALALADRVVVMNVGRVEQIGTPEEVYEKPATAFVAKFLGESNVLPATVSEARDGTVVCDIGGYHVCSQTRERFDNGERTEVIVRTERLTLGTEPLATDNCFQGRLAHVIYLGGSIRYLIHLGPHRLIAVDKNRGHPSISHGADTVYVGWSVCDSFVVKAP